MKRLLVCLVLVMTVILPSIVHADDLVIADESQIVIGGDYGWQLQQILVGQLVPPAGIKVTEQAKAAKITGTATVIRDDRSVTVNSRSGATVNYTKLTTIVHLMLMRYNPRTGALIGNYRADVGLEKVIDLDIAGYNTNGNASASGGSANPEEELLFQAAQQALTVLKGQIDPPKPVAKPAPAQPVLGPSARDSLPPIASPLPATPPPAQVQASAPKPVAKITGKVDLLMASGKPASIVIPANKPVGVGDQVWFVANSAVTGKFQVIGLTGQTLVLKQLWGAEPQDGEGFAVVYP